MLFGWILFLFFEISKVFCVLFKTLNLTVIQKFLVGILHYITLHTLLTFPTGFFNDNLHQIKLFKTNVSNNLKVIYKLDRREKLYVLFIVVIYKVSNIVFLLRILI